MTNDILTPRQRLVTLMAQNLMPQLSSGYSAPALARDVVVLINEVEAAMYSKGWRDAMEAATCAVKKLREENEAAGYSKGWKDCEDAFRKYS